MTYYLLDQSPSLMKDSFFYYRRNMDSRNDKIVAIVEDELSTEADMIQSQKKLLELEGEYRSTFKKWHIPPVNLNTVFLPKYSL